MLGKKLSPEQQKRERECRIKKRERMKANVIPSPKSRGVSKDRAGRPIDPQPASESRPGEREVEDSTADNAFQMGEAVPEALPLVIASTKEAGHVPPIFPFVIPPAIQRIFQSARWIRSSQTPTWSPENGWGFLDTRIHIERPLCSTYVAMAPDSANQNIIVAYPGIREAPPLPIHLSKESAKFPVEHLDDTPQLEEERLQSLLDHRQILSFEQFSNCSAYIGPSNPVVIPRQTQKKEMAYNQQTILPIFEGDEDPRRHWFICETIWSANDVDNEDKQMHH